MGGLLFLAILERCVSIYVCPPMEVGLTALGHYLAIEPSLHNMQTQFILDSTQFCLEHNYFKHLGGYYLQMHNTAMDASFEPCYVNLWPTPTCSARMWTHRVAC